ncbi:MAG: gliding motility-associated C-terminal domain-containing protein [Saprospiraceae bacterium]|nr:gliding motility-associated C-terminal domain-containing protein [Saprospiraceae bacterium]
MLRIFTLSIFLHLSVLVFSQAPPNDNCANALQLNNVNNFCGQQVFGTPTFDITDGPCPPTFAPPLNIWFRFTAVGNSVTIGAVSGSGLYKITLIRFPFGACGIPETLDCNLASLSFNGLQIGEEYFIVISSDIPSVNFELCVNNPVPVPPPNDAACDAIVLSNNVQSCGTTVDADFEFVPLTTPCPATATNQIWYQVDIQPNQTNLEITLQANSLAGSVQLLIGEWTDGCDGTLYNYEPDNIYCGPSTSVFEFTCMKTGTYYIMLSSNNAGAGTFCIKARMYGPPAGCALNDDCGNATKVPAFGINADPVCVAGCNIGACGEQFTSDGCNYNGSVVWFEVTIPAGASKLNITLNSPDLSLSNPQMQLFGGDCNNLTAITGCNSGANGTLNLLGLDVIESTTYFLAVGNNTGFAGNFNLCFSATDPQTACVTRSALAPVSRSSGLPLTAPLLPGETVNFQFTFTFSSTGNSCQWPHGVVPIFGNCWDVEASGIENTASGNFMWFNAGAVTYKADNPFLKIYTDDYGVTKLCYYVDPTCMGTPITTGTRLPAGWFYVNGGGPCADDSDPNQSWGQDCDGCESECDILFLFSMKTKTLEECEADPGILDCGIQMYVFSDRQTGCWSGGGDNTCLADFPTYLQASLNCCRPPTIVEEYEKICSGYTTNIEITSDQDDLGAVYSWTVNAPAAISGAAPGTGKFIRQTLNNSSANILTVEYIVTGISATGCPGDPTTIRVDVLPEMNVVLTTNPADGKGCASTPFDVFANATGGNGGPYEYLWSYQQSTDQSLLGITPGQQGTFPYTVTVTDTENGCTGTAEVTVTVGPKVDVDFQMDTTEFCAQNGPVPLEVVTQTNVVRYDWQVPFGPTPNTSTSIINIPSNPNAITDIQTGLFQVTITDENGCTGNTEINVSVYPTPRFYLNGTLPDEICVTDELIASGEPIDFGNLWLVLAESGSDYIWTGSAIPIGGKVYPADLLTLSGPGTYNVKLVVNSPYNCIDSIEHEFELLVPRELDLTPPPPLCATGSPVALSANPVGGTWSGPGVSNGLFDPGSLSPGTYKVYYVYIEGTCTSRDSMDVLIDAPPTISVTQVTPLCFDANPVQLNAAPTGGIWTSLTPGLLDANASFDPKLVSSAGIYQFVYTLTENGCDFTDTLAIEVYPELRADFQLTSPVCVTATSTIQFNGVAPAGTNYVWTVPNGTITNNNNGQITVQWNTSGPQDITLNIDINGCSNGPVTKSIIVERPLDDPEPDCATLTTTSVAFDWVDITGASGYIVNYGGTDFPQSTSDYSVTGLTPPGGEIPVSITVTAVGTGVCGNSNPVTVECISTPCPVINLSPSNPVLDFCVSPTTPPIQLTMVRTGGDNSGTGVWSGPFVSVSGSFDAASAGAGQYTFTYTYTEASCDYTGSVTLNLFEGSSPNWTSDKLEVCVDEVATITYTGNNLNGGSLVWDLDGGTELTGSTGNIKLVSWPSAGIKNVSVFVQDALCTPEVYTASIEVEAPLPTPNVTCGADPVSVTFNWDPIPGVSQYLISIDGGPFVPYSQTTYVITGLNQGDPPIEIRVIAVNSGPCGNSGIGSASCAPKPCVPIDVLITAVPAICLSSTTGSMLLSATANGSNGSGTYSWSGNGITNASTGSFDPNIAGIGNHTIDVRFNEDFCNYFAQIVIQVLEVPTADFTLNGPVCINETVRASHTGNAAAGATYAWTVNGGNIIAGSNTPNIDVQWATSGLKTVTLVVTQNGCSSVVVTMNITVEAPLLAPVIICSSSTTEVNFEWSPVAGATGYLVSINGAAAFTTTDLSSLVNGLTVGQVVTISVTAIAPAGYSCGNSATSNLVCEAEQCPVIFVDISEEDFICLKTNTPVITLGVSITGDVVSGSGQWIGGAGLTNDQLGLFDPALAGVGTHEIVYSYREKACNYYDTIYVDVRAQPIADFNATTPLCINETGTVQFTGTATLQGELMWNLDGANIISGSGTSNLEVSWSTSGDKNLELIIDDNGCISDPIAKVVRVDRRLAAPILNCNSTLTSIAFSWNNAGTEGYLVSVNGAPPTFVSTNSLDLQDLMTGDSVTISVIAIDSGPCGNSLPGELTCYAVNCADVVLTVEPTPTFCISDAGNTVTLSAVATGGFGGGSYTWSGPGIINGTGGVFDPSIAGPGDHEVFVTYRETVCPYQTSTIIKVTESPSLVLNAVDATCFGYKDGLISIEDVSGGTAPYTYSINGSVHGSLNQFDNLGQGNYVVEVKDANGCTQSFPIIVKQPERLSVDLGASILMETGDTVELAPILNIQPNTSTSYWWTGDESINCPTCPVITISPADQTTIKLEVTDSSGCMGADEITIMVKKKRRVFIPAAFSPNNDGINDMFFVFGGIEVARIESMQIFNRWGDEVFLNEDFPPNEQSEGWNGLHRGEVLNPSVFVYRIVVRFNDGSKENYYGDVSLMKPNGN